MGSSKRSDSVCLTKQLHDMHENWKGICQEYSWKLSNSKWGSLQGRTCRKFSSLMAARLRNWLLLLLLLASELINVHSHSEATTLVDSDR